jgi:hypothetical protein
MMLITADSYRDDYYYDYEWRESQDPFPVLI